MATVTESNAVTSTDASKVPSVTETSVITDTDAPVTDIVNETNDVPKTDASAEAPATEANVVPSTDVQTANPPSLITEAIGYVTDGFPGPGLRDIQRLITGHGPDGKGHFLVTDNGDHHRVMGQQQAVANILYSTTENPVNLNGDLDIKHAKENEPGLHITNGTVVRLIDFGPNLESPMHRAMSIDYGVVIEGEFEMTLDSGESRIMRQGDVSVQRATAHKWKNITGNGTLPGRMLYILLDCTELNVNGEKVQGYLGELEKEYEGRSA